MGYKEAVFFSVKPLELLTIIIPGFKGLFTQPSRFYLGQTWLKSFYFGILPLLFTIQALIFIRRKIIYYFGLLLIFSLILSLGENLFIYKYLYEYLPFFKLSRYPAKFVVLSAFAFSILCGFSINHFLQNIEKKYHYTFLISIVIFGIFLIFWWRYKVDLLNLLSKITINPPGLYTEVFINSLIITCFILIFYLIFFVSKLFSSHIKILSFSIIILTIIDLSFFTKGLNPIISAHFYSYTPKAISFLKQDNQLYRIIHDLHTIRYGNIIPKSRIIRFILQGKKFSFFDYVKQTQEFLNPNLGLLHFIHHADGYESLKLKDYMRLFFRLIHTDINKAKQLLNLLNVKYIITRYRLSSDLPWLKLVYDKPDVKIYKNLTYLPRAFLVGESIHRKKFKSQKDVFEYLFSKEFNPKEEVILETKKGYIKYINNSQVDLGRVEFINYSLNRIKLKVNAKKPCFLVLSDTYYPGWYAYIDHKKTNIYRANYAFRAIKINKGEHIVEFLYSPLTFKIGSIITLLTIVFILSTLLLKNKLIKFLQGHFLI
jgi:hypothetical protein